jgi:hypothetical protein
VKHVEQASESLLSKMESYRFTKGKPGGHMNNVDTDIEAFNEQMQMNEHLEAVLEDIKVRLQEVCALEEETCALSFKRDLLNQELAAKQSRLLQLRTYIQQELAAAVYPIVEYELRDALVPQDALGVTHYAQIINEALSDRCANLLSQLTGQK